MRNSKIIWPIVLIIFSLLWIYKAPVNLLGYFAPAILILTSVGVICADLINSAKEKNTLGKLKDMVTGLRGHSYYYRPCTTWELDELYSDFQKLFGDDLMNKNELKEIHNKNVNSIWIICRSNTPLVNRENDDKIGFFELFPITTPYSKKLLLNGTDGRTMGRKDIIGNDKVRNKNYYLGSIGILPKKNYNSVLFKGIVLKKFIEYIYNLNQDIGFTIFTRPITPDGIKLVAKYKFEKSDNSATTNDCIWTLKLEKKQIDYPTHG